MIRKLLFVVLALIITIFLFLLMRYLITPVGEPPTEEPKDTSVVITRSERDQTIKTSKRYTPEKPKLEIEPTPPPIVRTSPVSNPNSGVITGKIPIITDDRKTILTQTDRKATPIITIPPQYPEAALRNNTEGWAMAEFTITSAGTVEDAIIVEAEPERIFNRETLRAIKRWKYQPKMVDGKPVPQYNMREIFRFEIKK
ncbi:MAG: TonB family protein [Cellvibrionaceae bacterium]